MVTRHFATTVSPYLGRILGITYDREHALRDYDNPVHYITIFEEDMARQTLVLRLDHMSKIAVVIPQFGDTENDKHDMLDSAGSIEDLIAHAFGPPPSGKIGDVALDPEQIKEMTQCAMLLVNLVNGVLLTFIQSVADLDFNA